MILNSSSDSTPQFSALLRMMKTLEESGIDDEARGFILGKLLRQLMDRASMEVLSVVGETELKEMKKIDSPDERNKRIDSIFLEKKGMSIAEYREKLAEDLVQEFEAA